VHSYIRGVRAHSRDVKLYLLYSLASNVGIGVFTLLFNLYLVELGHKEDYIGRWNSVNTLAMAAIAFLVGHLINRSGVWRTVTVGLVIFIVTSVLACIITQPVPLLLIGALSGAGTAFLFVPTMPFIVELTGRHERHAVAALAFSLNSLSVTVGSLLGGWMPRGLSIAFGIDAPSAVAYRYTLIVGVLLAGFALIPLLMMSAERKRALPQDDEEPGGAHAAPVVHQPRTIRRHLIVFVAVGGLMSLGAGAMFPFYNVFLEREGASAGQIGLIFSAAGLMAAFVGLASPWVAHRMGSLKATVVIRLAPVPWYLMLMLLPNLPIAIVAHMLRTTSINMSWPIDSTYVSELLPARARASAFSYRSGAWNLGWSLSSLIAGKMIVERGYNVAFGAYAFFMVAAMALFYGYFARAARRPATPLLEVVEPLAATK
jgi:MFS family permease